MSSKDRSRGYTPDPDEPCETSQESPAEDERARNDFVEGILTRGEAAAEGEELTPGQTHEVVEEEGGQRVRRRRFSMTD